jgi:glycosyltransferase involved in cell wall biosynthesis
LWADQPQWDTELETFAEIRQFDATLDTPIDLRSLPTRHTGPECVLIHIGNSWVFHSNILKLAHHMPTIGVLHDLAVQELLIDCCRNGLFPASNYKQGMEYWYGNTAAGLADALLEGEVSPAKVVDSVPGFEIALGRATGVVTHTEPAFTAVSARRFWPVYRLDLPFELKPSPGPNRSKSGPLRLMQFGHTGPNRRLEEVLHILSKLQAQIDFRFDIYGKLWDTDLIVNRISELGLTEKVYWHGFVEEAVLDRALAEAHLVFNLRHPTMGEASGSQLRIWAAEAASVVSNQGWYASVPEETVFRIPVESEASALTELLYQLSHDRSIGARVGSAGRAHLEAYHGTERYAEGILAIAEEYPRDCRDALIAERGRALIESAPRPQMLFNRLTETL